MKNHLSVLRDYLKKNILKYIFAMLFDVIFKVKYA